MICRLLNKGGFHTREDIAEHLYDASEGEIQVSARTVQRDIEQLRKDWRAPIVADKRGYSLSNSFEMPAELANNNDLAYIRDVAEIMHMGLNYATGDASRVRHAVNELNNYILTQQSFRKVRAEVLRQLHEAIDKNHPVQITYCSAHQGFKQTRRIIEPKRILTTNEYYVIAFCHKNQDVRTFALSRISECTILFDQMCPDRGDLGIEQFARSSSVYIPDEPGPCRIWFSPESTHYLTERIWPEDYSLSKNSDDSSILTIASGPTPDITTLVLRHCGHARPLSPPSLVAAVRERLQDQQNLMDLPESHFCSKAEKSY